MRSSRLRPSFREEQAFVRAGLTIIAGVDEAGRGPLAGPVVAGAVVLPQHLYQGPDNPGAESPWRRINDSKALTARQRNVSHILITEHAAAWGVGIVDAAAIDTMGIARATRLAMRQAIAMLQLQPQALLVDAVNLAEIGLPCRAIIKGDAKCYSIAAASIVAKVTRDQLMRELDQRHPGYGFARHKGYGTREHLQRLRELGPSPVHRRTFMPLRQALPGFESA